MVPAFEKFFRIQNGGDKKKHNLLKCVKNIELGKRKKDVDG